MSHSPAGQMRRSDSFNKQQEDPRRSTAHIHMPVLLTVYLLCHLSHSEGRAWFLSQRDDAGAKYLFTGEICHSCRGWKQCFLSRMNLFRFVKWTNFMCESDSKSPCHFHRENARPRRVDKSQSDT